MEDVIVSAGLPAAGGLVDWEGDATDEEDLLGGGAGLYGVLDGHGGIEAAEWARDHLPGNLAHALASGGPLGEALVVAFLRTDADFVRHASALNASAAAAAAAGRVRAAAAGGDSEDGGDPAGDGGGGIDSGCTAVVAVVAGRRLFVASAGDAEALLCRGPGRAPEILSVRHRPGGGPPH